MALGSLLEGGPLTRSVPLGARGERRALVQHTPSSQLGARLPFYGFGAGRAVGKEGSQSPRREGLRVDLVPVASGCRLCRFYVKKLMGGESFPAAGAAVAAVARRGG